MVEQHVIAAYILDKAEEAIMPLQRKPMLRLFENSYIINVCFHILSTNKRQEAPPIHEVAFQIEVAFFHRTKATPFRGTDMQCPRSITLMPEKVKDKCYTFISHDMEGWQRTAKAITDEIKEGIRRREQDYRQFGSG